MWAFTLQFSQLYFCYFTIVYLTWFDTTSYSILLPVSISALVFRLRQKSRQVIEYDNKSYQVKNNIVKSTNTKIATGFSFPELHSNKQISQSPHVVDLNIYRHDMIIGLDLIRFLGIDIRGSDMTIHWDDAAIPLRDIYSTTKDVFALS